MSGRLHCRHQVTTQFDNPVGSDGRFVPGTPLFEGEHVFEANKHVSAVLKERGALLHEETLKHSYPHCWRCKNPVIFRATAQWFISMEQAGLRKGALREIGKVKWMRVGLEPHRNIIPPALLG